MAKSVPLDPQTLLTAYANGIFPMAGRDGSIEWFSADPRGVIPLESFHVPGRSLPQILRQNKFEIRLNSDFEATMRACQENRADGTWINDRLIAAYVALHRLGFAHSVEAWQAEKLVGGLYGVSLGAAFFGESMFHRVRDASKVALVHLVQRLRQRDFRLLDTQAVTSHLARFGCVEIPAEQYLAQLQEAIKLPRTFD
jgi:leucyl/phenylalanyl-tRNA---protein transferase